ncbi:hypothetical protein J6590_086398 [Homalodisca vitripennis]|nr:hypothetical protein J6590_086398 [Homalodisca vitripennis]
MTIIICCSRERIPELQPVFGDNAIFPDYMLLQNAVLSLYGKPRQIWTGLGKGTPLLFTFLFRKPSTFHSAASFMSTLYTRVFSPRMAFTRTKSFIKGDHREPDIFGIASTRSAKMGEGGECGE